MEGEWPYSYRKLIKEKNLSLTLAIAIPNVLLLSQVTVISSVPHLCIWILSAWILLLLAYKSLCRSKILHFLPHFGSTEGIRTVVNCLFLSSSGFCGRKLAFLLLAYMEPESAPELSRQQLLLGEPQKRKWQERPPENQGLLLYVI